MFYGSPKTKRYLWTIVIGALLSVACIVGFALGAGVNFAYMAFGGFMFSLAYSQLGTFKDITMDFGEKIPNASKDRKNLENDNEQINKNPKKKRSNEKEGENKNELDHYTEETLKKYLVEYKVRKQSFLVVIDSSEKYKIKNCPGYVWSDKKYLYFLLLEKKPRTIGIPRNQAAILRYEKGVMVTDLEEYKKLKESFLLGNMYRKFLPEYYRNMVNGFSTFKKDLFIIGDDIKITPLSVKGIMKVTNCKFQLDDKQLDKKRFGGYFEEVYKVNLLLREGIYEQEEYKEKVKEILTDLAHHEEQIEAYRSTIGLLVQYHLITDEYADYYLEYREKIEQKKGKK